MARSLTRMPAALRSFTTASPRSEIRDRGEFPGIESFRIAGFGEQLLGLVQVVGWRLDLQREVHDARHDHARWRAETQARRLVYPLAIERQVRR